MLRISIMSFRAKNLKPQDVSSRIHKYEMNNRNVGTQHDFLYNFSQRVNFAISQIGMRNSPRNFESAVIRGFTGVVEINGRDYFLIGVVVAAYRRSSYSIDRIFFV